MARPVVASLLAVPMMYQGAEQDRAMTPKLERPRLACAVTAPPNCSAELSGGTRFECPPGVHRPARQGRVTAECVLAIHLRLPLWQ